MTSRNYRPCRAEGRNEAPSLPYIVGLCAILPIPPASADSPGPLTIHDIDELSQLATSVRKVLEGGMLDFSRARIRDTSGGVFVAHDTQQRNYVLCGEINSPNRYGGYTGWQSILIKEDGTGHFQIYLQDKVAENIWVVAICHDAMMGTAWLKSRDFSADLRP
jgi:hypothetical protein